MADPGSRARPERRSLERSLGEQINALISATRRLSEESAATFREGLQSAGFHIARWLHAFGPARSSVVADAVPMDRGSTSGLIWRMRDFDLVVSARDPQDGRGVLVGLTEDGHARVRAVLTIRGEHFFDRLAPWNWGSCCPRRRIECNAAPEFS